MTTPRLVKNILPGIPGTTSGSGSQGRFTAVGKLLFFVADDGVTGRELWRSDGTSDGTFLVSDIYSGSFSSEPNELTDLGGNVYFRASDGTNIPNWPNQHNGLYKSDGTKNGSSLVAKDLSPYGIVSPLYINTFNNTLYFSNWFYGGTLWKSDGSTSGTRPIKNLSVASNFTTVGSTLFFSASDTSFSNRELWKTDGTDLGTVRVVDIVPEDIGSAPRGLIAVGNTLFFGAEDGASGFELWKSDGTAIGTVRVADIYPGSAHGLQLHNDQLFTRLGQVIFFSANDGQTGFELWKSDGSQFGTRRLSDINPGPGSSRPREMTAVGSRVFFTAYDGKGYVLWKSDGTSQGTQLVSRINNSNIYISGPRYLTAAGNHVFFTAIGDSSKGRELWKSDGTSAGTVPVADIFPGSGGSDPRDLKVVANTLYFSAKSSATSGRQLWALDLSATPPILTQGSKYTIARLNLPNLNSDGHEGSRHPFRITRSGNIASAGSVRFATSSGTATSGVDFLPFSRDIQFLAGEDKKDVYVDSRKDSLNEGTERFNVSITKINARDTIAKASTYGEIFNLPPASTYSIERRSSDGKEGHRHTFLIKRTGGLSSTGQVRVSTSSDSAGSGIDFNAYSAIRTFAVNQNEQIVYVDSRKDSSNEGTERFNISLSIVRSQDKLNVATTFGQIFDVPPPLTYSIETLNTVDRKSDGLEGSRHYFRVKRSGNTAVSGSIRFSTSSGSAISNNDFLPYSTTIVFQPGEIEKYVYVDSIVDSLNEGAENLKASISKISPQDILGSSSVVGVIRNRIINYNGVDKDGKSFTMLAVADTGLRHSKPSWSVQFDLKGSRIDPSLPTYVYVHGWKDKSTSKNSRLISSALGSERANVVLVDWSQMASVDSPLEPSLAVTVTRQVGESVADFLIKSGISPAMTTIVGHSLGSFVSASAALDVKNRTGKKIKELVALDNAYGLFYDIDARNYTYDKPLDFSNDLAVVTSSYTASDLVLFVKDWAGDNQRAATAQNAYIVQYARSSNLPNPLNPALQANAFHSGVIGVYADLFVKKALHPRVQNKFDASGKPATDGQFDGVIVAPMPWAYYGGNPVVAAPKAIGWTDSYDDPMIYGSASSDILFFDKFTGDHNGSSLNGLAGNDWIIADQTDGDGIDVLTGGLGTDTFWLGYERYGRKRESYTNPEKNSRGPDSAYALISDFKSSEDYIRLPLAKSSYSFVAASALPQFVSKTHGNGTGILSNGDLVAYVSGLSVPVFTNLIDKRITFAYHAPLDSQLFA